MKQDWKRERMEAAFNAMIDDYCEMWGIRAAIRFLLDEGLTKTDLIELKFDEDDIDCVVKSMKED